MLLQHLNRRLNWRHEGSSNIIDIDNKHSTHHWRLLKFVLKRHNQHTLNTPLSCRVIYWLRLCQHDWHFTPTEYFIWSGFLSIIKTDHESHHSLSVFSVQMIASYIWLRLLWTVILLIMGLRVFISLAVYFIVINVWRYQWLSS